MSEQSNIPQVNITTHGEHDCCKQHTDNSNYEPSNKTISIRESTLKKLRTYGTYGSTLDSIIRYLIDRVDRPNKVQKLSLGAYKFIAVPGGSPSLFGSLSGSSTNTRQRYGRSLANIVTKSARPLTTATDSAFWPCCGFGVAAGGGVCPSTY